MSTAGTDVIARAPRAISTDFPRLTTIAVILALAAGVVFRLFYPGAIEFHGDEKFSYDHLMAVLNGGPWPSLGMTMSIGGPNPGMSVWIFIIIGMIGHATTPVGLAECVQVLNIIALLGFVGFVIRAIPREQREPWLWGAALWAVNPIAIIYERKIWPPSTLPAFVVVMLAGWWYRRTWFGSFAFAAIAILGGQIHPTSAFLGVAILAWTVFKERGGSFRWTGLVAGAVIGFLPAIYWVSAYLASRNALHRLRPPSPEFYGRWLTTPFGYGPDHILGPVEFPRFLGWPEVNGGPTYLVLAVYVAIIVAALAILIPVARRALANPPTLRWYIVGDTPAGLLVRAALIGFGLILTVLSALGGGLYAHYMIVVTPLMTLWVALAATYADGGVLRDSGRRLLTALCLLDAAVVLLMFSYIHTIGDIHGEFGPSWEWQQTQPPASRT